MTESDEDRAVSETLGVATLVLLTVVVTASVGVSVLFVEEGSESGIDAEFEFEYFSGQNSLLITYNDGQELTATNVTISTTDKNVTWAELNELNETATISPGDLAQLRQNNPYGSRITPGIEIDIIYMDEGNATVVGQYNVTRQSGR